MNKGAYHWSTEAQEAFEKLKAGMVTLPVLTLPYFNKSFEIETDALGYGIGVISMQQMCPIAYFSHTLSAND